MGIDTTVNHRRSCSSTNGGKTFSFDTLRPFYEPNEKWQGEYMVRLHIALQEEQQVFADDFNRSDVYGPDWTPKSGKWDIRPGNLRANGPGAVMMCTRRFETPFRIEYECYSDNPCDLSIELRKKLDGASICFVGFGAENNTLNKIHVPDEGRIAVNKNSLIEINRKHKVTVEVDDDGTIRQSVDGQETLKATIRRFPEKMFFGFYIWNQGVFNNVKVFSPHAGEQKVTDKKSFVAWDKGPVVRQWKSFNDCAVGAITNANIKVISGEKCSVKIADVPTWLYRFRKFSDKWRSYDENSDPGIPEPKRSTVTNKGARFVSDPCVELLDKNGKPGQQASVVFPAPKMKKGFIEFDLMADHYAEDGLRIMLGDKTGLYINKDGDYYWQAGTNMIKLIDRVRLYHSVRGMARFYLQPKRWLTIRIEFDLEMSLANVGLVKIFNGVKRPHLEYLSVGDDLPLLTDSIREIRFETCGQGRFFVDNVFMISRTKDLAGDEKWRVPAREIMTAYYPLRKDPVHLKMWSMRNIRFMEGSGCPTGDELQDLRKYPDRYAVILDSAEKYNRIMVRQALLGEKMQGLERAWAYASKSAGKYQGKVDAARQAAVKTEKLLADLYEFYAACYLNQLNQNKLKAGFEPRHAALNTALKTAETKIQNTLEGMRKEVIRRNHVRFSPYAIETADTPSMKLEFTDGAFRRPDGKKDFLFVKTGYFLWPSMEKTLKFSPVCPLGASHTLRDLKEPEFCNNSTTSYFHRILTQKPDEQVALRINYGLHNHESSVPPWWFEKHKNDSDIFMQNSKGEIYVSPDQVFKQYNYWNPDVLAAQKATLEGLGELMVKHGYEKRISYLDLAQEAYFLAGPSGAWETGYNSTAVKTFRERLKTKYQQIGVLNDKWGSHYGSFEDISPPEDWRLKPKRVPGLTYEFELFRQDSWHAWMKQCHGWLKEKLGKDVPNSCQITYNGETCVNGLDWVKLFDTFNIVMEHYNQQFEREPITYRYLENLREVFKSTTGIGEWYVSGMGDIFDEENIRNNGLRQAYQQVQWGRSVLVYWQRHDFMFLHNGNTTENRLGHTVLRYHSAYIPVSIARAEAHRAIYLECPLVQPDIGRLESESSFYNVYGGRGNSSAIASLLFNKGHNYGNLFERLVMDGRQKLDNYKVLILPSAACLPDVFVSKLLEWVKGGGVLLATGPVGVMNEYGVQSGKLLDDVLGAGQWNYEKKKLSVKEGPGLRVLARDSSKQPALLEKSYGAGKVYMRLRAGQEEAVYKIISRHAPRKFYGKDNRFHLAMRQGQKRVWHQFLSGKGEGDCLYLSLLNPDVYRTLEDEIVLEGEYKEVADISCNFPIVPSIKNGYTRFKVKLGPAEGIMIRIKK